LSFTLLDEGAAGGVVEPTDGHAQPLSAFRVLRFDQHVPDFNPRSHSKRSDLPSSVFLPE
jgi:hypothetical protein